MNLDKIAALGLMSPQAVDKARSDALTQALFNIGSAFSAAGAPSRVPGGRPLNLAPVFQGYQNSLANSVKQALMLNQLERQEEEYQLAKENRKKLARMFASDRKLMPTGRQIPTGDFKENVQFVSDLSYEHPQGLFGNLPTSGPGSSYWKMPGFQDYDPRQVTRKTTREPITKPEMELRETNPNLLALPKALRNLVSEMGPAGLGGEIGTALLTTAIKPAKVAHVARPDGTVLFYDKNTGQPINTPPSISGQPSFLRGTGMTQQAGNILDSIGPKIRDNTATPQERTRYNFAYNHLARDKTETRVDPVTNEQYTIKVPGMNLDAFPRPPSDATAPQVTTQPQGRAGSASGETGRALPSKPTEGEINSAAFYDRMEFALPVFDRLESDPVNTPYLSQAQVIAGAIGGDYIQRKTMTGAQAEYYVAAMDWIRAKLRKESGAAIGEKEMQEDYTTFFPQPGDTQGVRNYKRKARERITEQMKRSAAGARLYFQAVERRSSKQKGGDQVKSTYKVGDRIDVNGKVYEYRGGADNNKNNWVLVR